MSFGESDNLGDAVDGDAVPLLDRKGMIGRLDLDSRPSKIVAKMDHRLEASRRRIERNCGVEPPEEWADVSALRHLDRADPKLETWSAQRNPYALYERLFGSLDGKLDQTANVEFGVIYHAGIVIDQASFCTIGLGNREEVGRSGKVIGRDVGVPLAACLATEADGRRARIIRLGHGDTSDQVPPIFPRSRSMARLSGTRVDL